MGKQRKTEKLAQDDVDAHKLKFPTHLPEVQYDPTGTPDPEPAPSTTND